MKNKSIKLSLMIPYLSVILLATACQKEDLSAENNSVEMPTASETLALDAPTETISTSTTTSTTRIEAENYASMSGVIKETCSEGGQNVGAIQAGDYMNYTVTAPAAGSYKLNFRIGSYAGGGQFQVRNSAGTVLATVTAPKTGSYQTYATVSVNANLAAGSQTIRLHAVSGGYNINWFEVVGSTTSGGTTDGSTSGSTTPTSTVRIEAESYTSMSGVGLDACSEGGKNVGSIQAGDYMNYTVTTPAAGSYKMNFRVAGPGGQFQVRNAAGTVLATVTTPKTASYQTYTTVSVNANLAAGSQTVRLHAVSGGFNINWFEVVGGTSTSGSTGGTTDGSTSSGSTTDGSTSSGSTSGSTTTSGSTGSTTIGSNILYREAFETSTPWANFGKEWSTSYGFTTASSPVNQGLKSGRFELRDGDPSYRSEVRFSSSYNGTDRWFAFSVYWPSAGMKDDSKPEIFHQAHQTSQTSPPVSLIIKGGRIYAEVNGQVFSGQLGTGTSKTMDIGAVPKDRWVRFVIRYKFSYNTDGAWQIWQNGQQVLNYTGKTIYPPAITTSLPTFKLGIYKWVWNGSTPSDANLRIMYVDDVRVGSGSSTLSTM